MTRRVNLAFVALATNELMSEKELGNTFKQDAWEELEKAGDLMNSRWKSLRSLLKRNIAWKCRTLSVKDQATHLIEHEAWEDAIESAREAHDDAVMEYENAERTWKEWLRYIDEINGQLEAIGDAEDDNESTGSTDTVVVLDSDEELCDDCVEGGYCDSHESTSDAPPQAVPAGGDIQGVMSWQRKEDGANPGPPWIRLADLSPEYSGLLELWCGEGSETPEGMYA